MLSIWIIQWMGYKRKVWKNIYIKKKFKNVALWQHIQWWCGNSFSFISCLFVLFFFFYFVDEDANIKTQIKRDWIQRYNGIINRFNEDIVYHLINVYKNNLFLSLFKYSLCPISAVWYCNWCVSGLSMFTRTFSTGTSSVASITRKHTEART